MAMMKVQMGTDPMAINAEVPQKSKNKSTIKPGYTTLQHIP